MLDLGSAETLYWLGMLATDGCLTLSRRFKIVQLGLHKRDISLLEKFQQFLGSRHPVYVCGNFAQAKHTKPQLFDELVELGITPRKTKTLRVDDRLASSRDFWRGAIDGDGTIGWSTIRKKYVYPKVQLVSASRLFLEQWQSYLAPLGPVRTIYPHLGGYVVHASGTLAEKIVTVLYAEATISLARKQERAERIMKESRREF